VGGPRIAHGSLRESLVEAMQAPLRRPRTGGAVQRRQLLWALRNVGFEVGWGEVLGIVARDGAGKSRLLKIPSRVTYPTTGHAQLHGRVGFLLEFGTSFHNQPSGRENIFLNGAILGMRRWRFSASSTRS
jgi:lipopolysaccharide transport system ATP-binding protein